MYYLVCLKSERKCGWLVSWLVSWLVGWFVDLSVLDITFIFSGAITFITDTENSHEF